jgi:hypothetical protein
MDDNIICLCDTCPCFCSEDNYDNYLCEGCDPYSLYDDYDFEDEGDDQYE